MNSNSPSRLILVLSAALLLLNLSDATAEDRFASYFEDDVTAASISPDGKHYAYGLRENKELFLCVIDLETMQTKRVKVGEDAPLPNDHKKIDRPSIMSHLSWATPNKIIYKPDRYRLFSISTDLSDPVELLRYEGQDTFEPTQNSLFYVSRYVRSMLIDDPDYILVESTALSSTNVGTWVTGRQYDTYHVNIHTGAAIPQNGVYGATNTLFIGADGITRASEVKRSSHSYQLQVAHPKTGKLTPIRKLIGDKIVDEHRLERDRKDGLDSLLGEAVILDFGYNPEWMFFASNANRDKYAIFAVNLLTREVRGPIFEDDRFDIVTPRSRLDYNVLFHSYITRNLAKIKTNFEKRIDFWLDGTFRAAQEKVDALLPATDKHFTSWSDDLKKFIVQTSGGEYRWKTLLFDAETETLQTLLKGPPSPSITVPIWIPAPQGHQLLCYLTVPKSTKPGVPNKTVALLSGGAWVRNYMGPNDNVRLLVDQGYTVLQLNPRGSVGFGKAFTLAASHRFADAALEDLVTAIDWCITNRISQAADIVAIGDEIGGYLALYASAKRPDLFRHTVAISPITNLLKFLNESRANSENDWMRHLFTHEMLDKSRKDRRDLRAESPFHLAENYKNPVLLVHGLDDTFVSVSHSQSLFNKLEKQSPAHRYLPIKDAGHGGWTPAQIEQIYSTLVSFIEAPQ